MADEIKSNLGKKKNLVRNLVVYASILALFGSLGFKYGRYVGNSEKTVKQIITRNVNKDYKDDLIFIYNDGSREAFIKQENDSYIPWNEARRSLYKSIDDIATQVENEIKK